MKASSLESQKLIALQKQHKKLKNQLKEKTTEFQALKKRCRILEKQLQLDFQEIADLNYALDQSTILAITDKTGKITFANEQFCKISKYSRSELIGQDHRILSSGYHPKSYIRDLWKTIKRGEIWKGEIKNKAKDGNFYWTYMTIVPLLDRKGRPDQYVAIRNDITEQKEIEEKNLKQQAELEAIFKTVPDLYLWIEETGKIVDYRVSSEVDLFFSTEGLLDKTFDHIFPDSVSKQFKLAHEVVLERAEQMQIQYRLKHNDEEKYFEARFFSLFEKKVLIIIRDMTEKRTVKEILNSIPQRILLAQERERSRISRDIHDDLGQLLVALKMKYYTLVNDLLENPKLFESESKKLLKTFDQLLDKTRQLSRGLHPPSIASIGLSSTVRNLVKNLRENEGRVKIQFRAINLDQFNFRSDPINLYRMIQEALSNALKHAKASCININISKRKGMLFVKIRDNGRGFDLTEEHASQGLGFLTMRERAEMLGAEFILNSKPNEGTTIQLIIPVEMKEVKNVTN